MFDFLKEIPLSAVLREKLKGVESEVAKLRQENERLVAAVEQKNGEVHALTKQIETLTARLSPPPLTKLPQVQESILAVLAEHGQLEASLIAKLTNVGLQVAAYHLEELRRSKYVQVLHIQGSEWAGEPSKTAWSLQHPGREYLIENGLIQ